MNNFCYFLNNLRYFEQSLLIRSLPPPPLFKYLFPYHEFMSKKKIKEERSYDTFLVWNSLASIFNFGTPVVG